MRSQTICLAPVCWLCLTFLWVPGLHAQLDNGVPPLQETPDSIYQLLDVNKDGELSTDELKNATKRLVTLDKNQDGKLTAAEISLDQESNNVTANQPRAANDTAKRLQLITEQLANRERDLANLRVSHELVTEREKVYRAQSERALAEVQALTKQLVATVQDRNDKFKRLLELNEEVTRLRETLKNLAGRNRQPIPRQLAVGRANPAAPKVESVVTAVKERFVEVGIGSDDGLRAGQQLSVQRDSETIAEIKIIRTTSKRALGQVIGKPQAPIKVKDRVLAKPIQNKRLDSE